ncbi:MAG TPA: glycoside hydrolase domain-containing protein [Candidatus Binatia bacterium]|jgi:hypothetical protein|nr:glycoside hydrolase domain-containing protein [Candidatus Binatia bacterium]
MLHYFLLGPRSISVQSKHCLCRFVYPYLLYYAVAAGEAQRIIRTSWIPMFQQGVMYEGVRPKIPHNGWQDHYTSNSGWLLASMLGLYPVPAAPGQFSISSPAVTKAVIHNGKHQISVEAKKNHGGNIYIRSIKVDGNVYPSYMISAKRLAGGARIELEMDSNPSSGLGPVYLSSTDGFVLSAELVSASLLKCTLESPLLEATSKIYSRAKPAKVLVNGRDDCQWTCDETKKMVTLQTSGMAAIEVNSE